MEGAARAGGDPPWTDCPPRPAPPDRQPAPSQPPPPLRPPRSYIEHADDGGDAARLASVSQTEILSALSPGLRQEVMLFTNAGLLSRLPSLARQAPEVQAFVVERLRRRIVSARGDGGGGM